TYDPAFTFELAAIVKDGIDRMYGKNEDLFYYLSVYNEDYDQVAMPNIPDLEDKICKGMYKYRQSEKGKAKVHLFGSGTLFNDSLKAAEILEKDYGFATDVWSVTSYKRLRTD